MSSSEEKLNEVPPGVSYGERVDVPVGNESNPRIKFLQSQIYLMFSFIISFISSKV